MHRQTDVLLFAHDDDPLANDVVPIASDVVPCAYYGQSTTAAAGDIDEVSMAVTWSDASDFDNTKPGTCFESELKKANNRVLC